MRSTRARRHTAGGGRKRGLIMTVRATDLHHALSHGPADGPRHRSLHLHEACSRLWDAHDLIPDSIFSPAAHDRAPCGQLRPRFRDGTDASPRRLPYGAGRFGMPTRLGGEIEVHHSDRHLRTGQGLRRDAGAGRARPDRSCGRGARLPGPQRGRQDHHHPDPAGPAAQDRRRRSLCWAATRGATPPTCTGGWPTSRAR